MSGIETPATAAAPVTDVLHGVAVSDPYRWLEDPRSERTRDWLAEQERRTRAYFERLPARGAIRKRVREFLAVETYDSFLIAGDRYFFRKRRAAEEQPSIYMREGAHGADQLLIDPAARGEGRYTAVKPVRVSPDGRLLLYEIKSGGERVGRFDLFDTETGIVLPDALGRGYLAGFAFAADSKSFYYVHEPAESAAPARKVVRHHILGTPFTEDREIFFGGDERTLRLHVISDRSRLGLLVSRLGDETRTSFYVQAMGSSENTTPVFTDAKCSFVPRLAHGRIFALTDCEAPNLRIVELRPRGDRDFDWAEVVPEERSRIQQWAITRSRILVSRIWQSNTAISAYDFAGHETNEWPLRTGGNTLRFLASSPESEKIVVETESFTRPPATLLCSADTNRFGLGCENGSLPLGQLRSPSGLVRRERRNAHTHVPCGTQGCAAPRVAPGAHDLLRRIRGSDDTAVQCSGRLPPRTRLPVCAARYSWRRRVRDGVARGRATPEAPDRV